MLTASTGASPTVVRIWSGNSRNGKKEKHPLARTLGEKKENVFFESDKFILPQSDG
ncbi:MAG: hypothetical protein K8E24_013720 [Methanobacterium paludis]|nr:hypothetical protein [Methanobacterium paludis]